MSTQQQSPVREYARLALLAQRYRAANQPLPHEIAAAMQEHETFAAATFGPQELARLQNMVWQEQQSLLAAERAHEADVQQVTSNASANLAQALRNRGARLMTKAAGVDRDGKGLNEAQMHQSSQRGKYVVPGRTPMLVREAAKVTRRTGKEATAADVSTTLLQMGELMDDSQKMDAYLTKQVGDDPTARRQLEQRIRTTWTSATLERRQDERLRERNPKAFEAQEVPLNDNEHRRLVIAQRVVAHEGPEAFLEVIHDRGKEGSIRSALADAFDEAEANDIDDETLHAAQDFNAVDDWASTAAVE